MGGPTLSVPDETRPEPVEGRAATASARLSRQTWTTLVAAASFVVLAALIALLPVPYVAWSPGLAQDTLGLLPGSAGASGEPVIRISGIATYPTTGRLDLMTISATRPDSSLSLPGALAAYWLPNRDALPRDTVYAPGKSAGEVSAEESEMMETAQSDAAVAALRAAAEPVVSMPVVAGVTVGGPAQNRLKPGDLIVSVGGVKVRRVEDVGTQIRKHEVGDVVSFVVLRDGVQTRVDVVTAAAGSQAGVPILGITVGTGYRYVPRISFDLGQQIGGPSAGLVFSLAIYDKITPGPLLRGFHLAGTGTIAPDGAVGAIGGIQEKIAAASRSGATAFLLPAANCGDLADGHPSMSLIKVADLEDAIRAVRALTSGAAPSTLPRC
jgi:PDZ domain-containing protein